MQEGAGRPQRSRQASKCLTLPGEEEPSGQQQAPQQRPVKPPVAGRAAGDAAGAERQQEQQHQCWPSDAELLQAVAAAGVACLHAGVGSVSWGPSDSGSSLQVSLESFMFGNPISCHLTALQQHPVAAKLRLCQQVGCRLVVEVWVVDRHSQQQAGCVQVHAVELGVPQSFSNTLVLTLRWLVALHAGC